MTLNVKAHKFRVLIFWFFLTIGKNDVIPTDSQIATHFSIGFNYKHRVNFALHHRKKRKKY